MERTVNKPNWIQYVSAALIVVALCFAFSANSNVKEIEEVDYDKIQAFVEAAQAENVGPSAEEIAALVTVEDADNENLNEFLEDYFGEEYTNIKDAAEEFATEELEDNDYEVVVNYLKTLVEGLDEDSVNVDIEDVDVTVTALGLKEDEDKSATVKFEIEVEYELEEGVVEEYKLDLDLEYNVEFDEGDLDDESVSLISIE